MMCIAQSKDRAIPFHYRKRRKIASLTVVVNDAQQALKNDNTALNASKLEEKILMLNNFLKELPFPKSKLEAYARFA